MVRAVVLAIALAAASGAACGQVPPATPYYAMDPDIAADAARRQPGAAAVLENYRTQLLQSQRDSLQQNPSGLGRDELQLGNQLNTFNGPAAMTPPSVAAPAPPFPSIPPGPLFNSAAPP